MAINRCCFASFYTLCIICLQLLLNGHLALSWVVFLLSDIINLFWGVFLLFLMFSLDFFFFTVSALCTSVELNQSSQFLHHNKCSPAFCCCEDVKPQTDEQIKLVLLGDTAGKFHLYTQLGCTIVTFARPHLKMLCIVALN